MTIEQVDNLVGALSLAVSDRMAEAITDASGHAETGAAAISALDRLLDGPSIDTLGRALGLTSSGTVRLVDRLAASGLVRRDAAADERVSRVRLTPAGRRAATRVRAARGAVLSGIVGVLSPKEREQLAVLAARMLEELVRTKRRYVRWTCRLCDTGACGRAEGRCPVAIAGAGLAERGLPQFVMPVPRSSASRPRARS